MKKQIEAGKFKAECVKIMDEVKTKKYCYHPIAKIVPIEEETESLFGKMKGTIHIKRDIIAPIGRIGIPKLKTIK